MWAVCLSSLWQHSVGSWWQTLQLGHRLNNGGGGRGCPVVDTAASSQIHSGLNTGHSWAHQAGCGASENIWEVKWCAGGKEWGEEWEKQLWAQRLEWEELLKAWSRHFLGKPQWSRHFLEVHEDRGGADIHAVSDGGPCWSRYTCCSPWRTSCSRWWMFPERVAVHRELMLEHKKCVMEKWL